MRRLTGGLHCGQEQSDQHAYDGNDNQQLDQGEATASGHGVFSLGSNGRATMPESSDAVLDRDRAVLAPTTLCTAGRAKARLVPRRPRSPKLWLRLEFAKSGMWGKRAGLSVYRPAEDESCPSPVVTGDREPPLTSYSSGPLCRWPLASRP